MEILEEMYEEKLNHLKELLTDYYQEEIEVYETGWNICGNEVTRGLS